MASRSCSSSPGASTRGSGRSSERDIDRHADRGSRYTGAYGRFLQAQRLAAPIMGSPSQCASVIAGAIESGSPRSRYLVGLDAQAINLTSRLTPSFVQDRFLRLVLDL